MYLLFETGNFTLWIKVILKSFESEFDRISQRLTHRLEHLDQLLTLLHRSDVHDALRRQRDLQADTIKSLEQLSAYTNSQRQDIMIWLASVDSAEVFRRNLQKRSPTTCQWIRSQPIYKQWSGMSKATPDTSHLFWICGNAGMGKTVLCASIIQQVVEEVDIERVDTNTSTPPVLLYFFFDKKDDSRNSMLHMYRTFLFQLLANPQSATIALAILEPAYRTSIKYGRSKAIWSDGLPDLLKQIVEQSQRQRVLILLDGLDECTDPDPWLRGFVNTFRSLGNCWALVFSRYQPEIRDVLFGSPMLKMTSALTRPDVDKYLSRSIHCVPGEGPQVNRCLLSRLSSDADGLFLWASLAVEQLKAAVSPSDISAMVSCVPEKLGMVYDRALRSIVEAGPPGRVRLVRALLCRVLCSPRPLTWRELQHSLSVEPSVPEDGPVLWEGKRPFLDAVLKLCPPFIEYSFESETFRAHHLSVHQFLMVQNEQDDSTGMKVFPPLAHCDLAKVCLAYLSQPVLQGDLGSTVDSPDYPLAPYATKYLCYHLTNSSPDAQLCQSTARFFSSENMRRHWIMRWLMLEADSFPLHLILKSLKSVHELLREPCAEELSSSTGRDFNELEDMVEILSQWGSLQGNSACSNFERIMVLRDLARVYKKVNQLKAGIKHLQTLKNRLESQQRSQSSTVWILTGLGLLYDQQGKVQRALDVQYEALAIQQEDREKQVPAPRSKREDDLSSLDESLTLNELGRLHRHLGHWDKSQSMHLRALAILRGLGFPDDDPQILWTLNTLARCYRMGGRPKEGLRLGLQALTGYTRLLGPEHPHTLWTMSDVAKCHRACGDLEAACTLQEESVQLRSWILGPSHHDTLWAINDLGLLFELAGEEDRALDMHERAMKGQEMTLGMDHKTTCWSRAAVEKLKGIKEVDGAV